MEQPDPKWHLRISLLKSLLRIGAGVYLVMGNLIAAGSLLVAAEMLGIVEELV
jgi:hypothetical protein